MKKIVGIVWAICAVIFLSETSAKAQQQPIYSQYMFNMLNINPAYAGNRDVANITALMRKQWIGFPGAPTTGSLSYDVRQAGSNNGWGGQMYYDEIGIEKRTGLKGIYSYRIPFHGSFLSIGLSFGAVNFRENFTQTNPFQQGDQLLQVVVNGYVPTAGLGFLYANEKWYVGLSSPELLNTKVNSKNQAEVTSGATTQQYYLTGGYIFDASTAVKIKPSVLVEAVSGAPVQADLNINAWFGNTFGAGLSYRIGDAFVGLFELQLTPQLRMGYAYDYSIGPVAQYSRGTHELLLRLELGSKNSAKVLSPRYY